MRARRVLLGASVLLASACNLLTGVGRFDFGGGANAGGAASTSSAAATGGATTSSGSGVGGSSTVTSASTTSTGIGSGGSCPAGEKRCDGKCVSEADPTAGCASASCAACAALPHQASTCTNGACAAGACTPPYQDCDHDPTNGCEANVDTDVMNCGACGAACTNAHGTTSCASGVCSPACAAPWASCDGDPKNGCEANLKTSPVNCGSCGVACAPGLVCTSSGCGQGCTVGLALGQFYSCALKSDGTVWCWGYDADGELGAGATGGPVPTPAAIPTLSNVQQIAAGTTHACAVRTNSSLLCWGYNGDGELGLGNTMTPQPAPAPVTALLQTVNSVAAGVDHTCAVRGDGTVWCWGRNAYGEVDGTSVERNAPVQVMGLPASHKATAVTTGYQHTCALFDTGAVWCWGDDAYGELGAGPNAGPAPVQAQLGGAAVAISAGGGHTCAILSDKSLWCWGLDSSDQLGVGPQGKNQSTPVEVAALGNAVVAVAAGQYHTCALDDAATVWCWGDDKEGQLGDNQTTFAVASPSAVAGTFVQVAAGSNHTCAIQADGTLACWGRDASGEVGDGTMAATRAVPTPAMLPCP